MRRAAGLVATPWLDDVLAELEPGAVVVDWLSSSTPVWYAKRIQGRRPDISIADGRTRLDEHLGDIGDVIEHNLRSPAVYAIRVERSGLDCTVFRVTPPGLGRGRQ